MTSYGVVGGGLVGLGTALELQRLAPGARVVVLEKEAKVGQHQSGHNSGVLHAGLYYAPGSLKAKLAVSGIRRMTAFCREHAIPHEICGKVVVATNDAEVTRLRALEERGRANGLAGLRWLSAAELRELEPHAAGVVALHVPEEGIADYPRVSAKMAELVAARGGSVRTGARLVRARPERAGGWTLESTAGDIACDVLVNCAGLYADRVARLAGERPGVRVVPFRGEYYRLEGDAARLVRNLIYPVPDPAFPFLGVHFTRMIAGGVEAGPNAVLAGAREGYTKWRVHPGELADALTFSGTWRFLARHRRMVRAEIARSFSRRRFAESLRKLVPEVRESDLGPGGAGVRAQALAPDGTLVQDFLIVERPNAIHVLNAPSPAATASLAIGQYVAGKALMLLRAG